MVFTKTKKTKIEMKSIRLIFCVLIIYIGFGKVTKAQVLSIDAGPVSRYMAHGVDVGLADQEVFQFGISKPLPKGFNFTIWSSLPIDRKFDNLDEVDILLKWSRSFFEDSRVKIVPKCYIDYWFYHGVKKTIDVDGNQIDPITLQGIKANIGFSLPNLIKFSGNSIVLSYDYFYWSPLLEKTFSKGGIHEFKFNYLLPLQFDNKKQIINLGTSTNYSEKNILQPNSGWTNLAFHLSTAITSGSWTLSPSIHYQWTWKQSINEENEFWFGFNIGKSFGRN